MDLKTFIAATLSQIVEGVRDAQACTKGAVVADGYIASQGNMIAAGTSGFFTLVDFDVLVAAEMTDGGGTISVADITRGNEAKSTSSNLNRVKFSIHVRLPPGAKNADPIHGRSYRNDADYDSSTF